MSPTNNPQVCAICLTADRQALTDRAVRCFLAQTYRPSVLLIYDTGKKKYQTQGLATSRIVHVYDGPEMSGPIGKLRNTANSLTIPTTEVLIHWDSDDLSGPYRIQDQVASLQESGRDCVGYNNVLFWRRIIGQNDESHEAWVYNRINPPKPIGGSLCYWRRVWERVKFRDDYPRPGGGMGEDTAWLQFVDSKAYSTLPERDTSNLPLVCEIHGGNTTSYDIEAQKERGDTWWTRVPDWDARLQSLMAL
jgi:hypothetical protein